MSSSCENLLDRDFSKTFNAAEAVNAFDIERLSQLPIDVVSQCVQSSRVRECADKVGATRKGLNGAVFILQIMAIFWIRVIFKLLNGRKGPFLAVNAVELVFFGKHKQEFPCSLAVNRFVLLENAFCEAKCLVLLVAPKEEVGTLADQHDSLSRPAVHFLVRNVKVDVKHPVCVDLAKHAGFNASQE